MSRMIGCILGLALVAGIDAGADDPNAAFKVIVNPSVAGAALRRDVLAQIYLGGADRWGDGNTIAAVDLSSTSPVRRAFSEQVLGKSIDAVKYHWLRKIAGGQRPPLAKPSDDEVIAFVAAQRGSVGYVSAGTPLPPTVREVLLH